MNKTFLYRTPLFSEHVALGAKMVEFAGWQMPLQYREGIMQEHAANRRGVSLFDCSHMGEFLVEGDAQRSGLDRIVSQNIVDMPPGSCRYGFALNDKGGVIDDLIVYRKAPESWMIVVNAANIEKDRAHFEAHIGREAGFRDVSAAMAKLDLQGPLSRDVLAALVPGIAGLEYYTFGEFDWSGERVIISRTGYTGELGYEIYCPWGQASLFWQSLLADKRVVPTGLGVRDVLRIEMCFPLYGHELSETITPHEAGLKKFVDMQKDFHGREALQGRGMGTGMRIVHFLSSSRRSPRQGHAIMDAAGLRIGHVVSGTYSPSLMRGVGIGFIKKEFTNIGNDIIFGEEKFKESASVVPRPFYKEGSLKD
jgi:aminomethyltransferase